MQDGVAGVDLHSEEGSSDFSAGQLLQQKRQRQQQAAQYSSQDSLPDSPYSSQSLDSQPLSHSGGGENIFI